MDSLTKSKVGEPSVDGDPPESTERETLLTVPISVQPRKTTLSPEIGDLKDPDSNPPHPTKDGDESEQQQEQKQQMQPDQRQPEQPKPQESEPPQLAQPIEQEQPVRNPLASNKMNVALQTRSEPPETKQTDDKLSIYKALAIRLKKELVKCREELQKLRDNYDKDVKELRSTVNNLEQTLLSERQATSSSIAALESKAKRLEQELKNSEHDLESIQKDFENYRVQATKIMQKSTTVQSSSSKTFEEERYKQLKWLTEEQKNRLSTMESQLATSLDKNRELENEIKLLREQLDIAKEEVASLEITSSKCRALTSENENLKLALKQFRTKLKDQPVQAVDKSETSNDFVEVSNKSTSPISIGDKVIEESKLSRKDTGSTFATVDTSHSSTGSRDKETRDLGVRLSPTTSSKEGSPPNSNSLSDDSSSGYVHIKPAPFEIISKSSIFEEAHNQIENLTKAYLDSENTNALLTEQVSALKEEIRRLQRGKERLELADNLEYLKNILFKFLSLESNQMEQKQRLIPVLSTVLRLSPDETAKLHSLTAAERPSVASSFFKFS